MLDDKNRYLLKNGFAPSISGGFNSRSGDLSRFASQQQNQAQAIALNDYTNQAMTEQQNNITFS